MQWDINNVQPPLTVSNMHREVVGVERALWWTDNKYKVQHGEHIIRTCVCVMLCMCVSQYPNSSPERGLYITNWGWKLTQLQ